MKIKGTLFRLILFLLVPILLFSGCGTKKSENTSMSDSAATEAEFSEELSTEAAPMKETQTDTGSVNQVNLDRKIIKTGYIELETLQFDQVVTTISNRSKALGGFVQDSNIEGRRMNHDGNIAQRSASFSIRIPQAKFEDFILGLDSLGNIITNQTKGEDITSQYFDTEAHLKALQIQEERLLEILKQAVKVEDIIELERELTDIRYEIENLTGTIKKWDNLVQFSTINIEVFEVVEITKTKKPPVSLGEKLVSTFQGSISSIITIFKSLLIILVALIPFLVVILPFVFIGIYIYKRNKKRNLDKKA